MPTLLTALILRELGRHPTGWTSVNDLYRRVREQAGEPWAAEVFLLDLPDRSFRRRWPSTAEQAVEWCLDNLALAGILEQDKYGRDGELRWRLRPGWPGEGGSGEGGDRRDTGDGDGEGDGDGGIGEVLSHPYLFALSNDDFEDVLQQATGGTQ